MAVDIIVRNKVKLTNSNVYTPLKAGEFSKPIAFKPELVYYSAPIYASDDLGNAMTEQNLLDTTGITDYQGIPSGIPPNQGMQILQWDNYVVTWYNVQYYGVIFELDGPYNLDYAYIYGKDGKNQQFRLFGSEDGTTYKPLGQIADIGQAGWHKVDFLDDSTKGGNKYFILGLTYQDQGLGGLMLYGRPSQGIALNRGVKKARNVKTKTIDEATGTNGFYFEHPEVMAPVSGVHRFYVQPDWFMGDDFRRTGSLIGRPIDDMNFRFNNSHMGSIDQLLQGFKNYGSKVDFVIANMPVAFRPLTTGDAANSKPVDPGFSTVNLAHTTNPLNYKYISRIAWNIAARYGKNKDVDQRFIQLQPGQPVRVGLNQIYCLEVGNEMDKWWDEAQGYLNPEEAAAYMSAMYDGHKGAMGPGYGVKDADPSMRLSLSALAAGDNTTYLRKMLWWFDKNRGKGDYPFDVINFHWYNSSTGNSQQAADGSGAHGVQPEIGDLIDINRKWVNLRDTYAQYAEVWLTEVGYDEHLGGVFSPPKLTQFERSRCKAYWLVRMYMCCQYSGLDQVNQYWVANNGGTRFTDLDEYEPNAGKFLSSGLLDGIQSSDDFNRFPLMSYYYVASFRASLKGYLFSHAVMVQGVINTEELIIEGASLNVWAMAYINYTTHEQVIAIWLDSGDFLTSTATINVGASSAVVLDIDDAEIRKAVIPESSLLQAVNGKVTLTVTECPRFIKTTLIGTPKLLPAENILTQRIDAANVLVTWHDNNLKATFAKISRSTTAQGTYTPIYQGETFNASYVDSTVAPNTAYFYTVEFVREAADIDPIDPIDPTDPITFDETLNTYEQMASNAYYAATSLKAGTTASAVDDDSIGVIKDKVGAYDLIYEGVATPAIIGRPPILSTIKTDAPYITFENCPYTYYQTAEFNSLTGLPHAVTLILEYLPGQTYEGFLPGGSVGDYVGNYGSNLRAGNSDGTLYSVDNTFIDYFKRALIHIEYKATTIDFYVDGTFRGSVPSTAIAGELDDKIMNGLGVNTNNSCWHFFAMYNWYGAGYTSLAANRTAILQSLVSKWNIGQMQTNPYAFNIDTVYNQSTSIWSTTFDIINPEAAIVPTTYKWLLWVASGDAGNGGQFYPQIIVGTSATLPKSAIQQYLDAGTANLLSCYVNVGGWKYLKGPSMHLDNL